MNRQQTGRRQYEQAADSKLSTKEEKATAQKLAANLQAQQNFFHRQTAIQESSTKASFMLSFKLAKASKPLSEGEFLKECMVETARVLRPESKDKFEKISLSCRTVTRRVELIGEDITSNLNKKAEPFTLYSLALDESNDVKDTAQLFISILGINDTFEMTEEFLTMEPLKGQTRGEDLYDRVSAVVENMKLPCKLINGTTDGSPNLTGKNLNHVVNPVVKLVNFIRARGLQHQLQEKADEFPELSNKSWLCDFAFAADVFSHMNELNMKLQGKDQFVQDMYTNVKAFKSKLVLFSRQILNKSFTHFSTLATLNEAGAKVKKYSESLDALHGEFCRRFSDFEKIDKSLQLVACPLSKDPESAPEELQLELIDLQSDPVLKEKFNSLKLKDFYASLNEAAFPNLRRTAQKMLALFGLTYVCEQMFSIMNINKASHRSQLTDQNLRSILRIVTTKLTPDFDALAKKGDQQHCSH
ncbi:general transcription factor II-I repeat domain-containing protein 2A-like [Watersipora subatra]|uniref:general transcription factor II-I repeat domain-containing protein 2A-like n=1 Tax=Watersipora subatra TaxID=2589382 RepID=UPI00355C1620